MKTERWTTKEELDARGQLIKLLQHPSIGLDTMAIVAEAISVEAKFNLWFLKNVKGKDDNLEATTMEILDVLDPITKDAAAAVEQYYQDQDAKRLHETVRKFIESHTTIMENPKYARD